MPNIEKSAIIRWAIPSLAMLLFTLVIGCAEPQVVERIVEVEKVIEIEVPVEVVVTATPVKLDEDEVSKGEAQRPVLTPTVAERNTSVLHIGGDRHFTQLSALAFSEGISITVGGYWSDRGYSRGDVFPIPSEYRGVLVTDITPSHSELEGLRQFVASGGNAAIFISSCESDVLESLQFVFGVSCVIITRGKFEWNYYLELRGRGEQYSPHWGGLILETTDLNLRSKVAFVTGQSDEIACTSTATVASRSVCTSLSGTVGDGNVLFLLGSLNNSTRFEDGTLHSRDNMKAASRLLYWLVEEPSSRVLPSNNSPYFLFPLDELSTDSFHADSVLARFSTVDPVESEERADAVDRIISQHGLGGVDTARALDLVHIIAP